MLASGPTLSKFASHAISHAVLVLHLGIQHVVLALQDTSWNGLVSPVDMDVLMENMVILQLICVFFAITLARLVRVLVLISAQNAPTAT